jgi:hypothetical protein
MYCTTVSPLYCDVYLENIGFVYPVMSMMVIGPSLLYVLRQVLEQAEGIEIPEQDQNCSFLF